MLITYFVCLGQCIFSVLSIEETHLDTETCRCFSSDVDVLETKMKQKEAYKVLFLQFSALLPWCILSVYFSVTLVWASHPPCLKQLKNALIRCLLERDGLGWRSEELDFAYIQKKSVFLSLSATGILGRVILCCAGCLVPGGMFSIVGCSLASTHQMPRAAPSTFDPWKCLQIVPKVPWG